jgi:hypothetical protein
VTATDVSAQVRTWALAEATRQCFGEDFGIDIVLNAAQTPSGVQVGYLIVVSCRSPLLGQGPLFSLALLPTPQPTEQQITTLVRDRMRDLRELHAKTLTTPNAAQNGH